MKFAQLEMSKSAYSKWDSWDLTDWESTETVLSNLVSSFRFELTDVDLAWKNDVVVKPYIREPDGRISDIPSMPMKITVVGDSG
jgi:hypothetical protein